jgi:uncharacterized membrane-anchored protein YitT (DUF2179 family)
VNNIQKTLLVSLCLLPAFAHANMGKGIEGYVVLLVNNFFLAAVLLLNLILAMLKFFRTEKRRTIFVTINCLPLMVTIAACVRFLQAQPELSEGWLIIPAMLLGHLFSIAIPLVQYKMLSKHV